MLNIKTLPVTEFQQNCRILWREGERSALVIDPGGDADRITAFLNSAGLECTEIWLTHSHLDHCGGVAGLMATSGAVLTGHAVEKLFRGRVEEMKAMWGLTSAAMSNCPEPTRFLQGGETIEFDGTSFKVLFTPGHSPGHLCFYAESQKVLLAGDTLFAGSIGRTDLPGGDHETLINSIVEKILSLPDDTQVMPGHGPDTTVGRERVSNPFLTGEFDE